jgi:nicotinamide mononucleotide transporter PnuC
MKIIESVKLTRTEFIIWISSVTLIISFFLIFDRGNYLALVASLVGTTALIYNSRGEPLGPALLIIFSIMYGIISFGFRYYGEMITYVGMSLPMAIFALVSWLRNPFEKGKTQVRVNRISRGEVVFMLLLSFIVTVAFYFILEHFNTANLIPSTLSITTSFIAAYLTFRRSPYFAFAYAINDVILIVLWTFATIKDTSYLSVLVCFVVFLFNDTYGFTRWKIMQKRQEKTNPLK